MKKSKSYFKGFMWTGILLAGAFFVLPAVFPEDAAIIDKKLSAEASMQDGQNSALPVVFSDNPLSKFFKKLSKFYGLGKKTPSSSDGVSFSADREVFPLTASAGDSPEVSFGQEGGSPSAASMIFAAADGTEIKPDENGYFYGKEYYKNGQYPSEALKKSIENSIAKYHTLTAQEQQMHPVYVQNPDGSLKVQYVSSDDYAKYMGGATMGADGSPQSSFFASSNRYSGAKIESKESGMSSSKSSGGSSSSQGGSFSVDDGSMGGRFATLNARLEQNKKDTAKEAEEQQQKEKEDFEKKKLELLSSSERFKSNTYVEPSSSKRQIPAYNKDTFDKKPMILDRMFLTRFLTSFRVNTGNIDNKNVKTASLVQWPGGKEEDFAANILNEVGGEKTFKVLAGQTGGELIHDIHAIKKKVGEENVFFDHIAAPVNDYDKPKEERKSFKDTFFEDTGLKDVLRAAEVNNKEIARIEEEYKKIDEQNAKFVGELREIIKQDPTLRNLKPSTTIFLGKDKDANLVVATPVSFLYKFSPSAPKWISDKIKSSKEPEAYISVTPEEFLSHIKDDGSVIVTTYEEAQNKLKQLGARAVPLIKDQRLSSFSPDDIKYNMEQISNAVIFEAKRVATAKQQELLDKAKKLADQARKGTTNTHQKGVNAEGKSGTGTQHNYSPLMPKQSQSTNVWMPQDPFNKFMNNDASQNKGKAPLMLVPSQKGNTKGNTKGGKK